MSTAFDADPLDRHLRQVTNARDLGGTPTRDGGVIRPGRLLRSASLASATPADVRILQDAGVREVIDLRADWELASVGVVPSAFLTHRLVLVPDRDRAATHEVLRTGGLVGYYSWILDHARHLLVELVRIVVAADGGVLVQCGAGKDRTGLAVALLLDLVGVADQHIGADYARTADALTEIRAALRRTPGYDRAITELPREALGAPADAILATLRSLRTGSGSATEHLVGAGLDAGLVPRLRAKLVAQA